jgi:hypothetical protein
MSTAQTGAAQGDRLRALGFRVQLLPGLADFDGIEDAWQVASLVPRSRFATVMNDVAADSAPS